MLHNGKIWPYSMFKTELRGERIWANEISLCAGLPRVPETETKWLTERIV